MHILSHLKPAVITAVAAIDLKTVFFMILKKDLKSLHKSHIIS